VTPRSDDDVVKGLRCFLAGRGASAALVTLIGMIGGMIGAAAAQDGAPLRLPPGARLEVGAMRFDVQSLTLDVQTLNAPQGFGAPLAAGSALGGGSRDLDLPGMSVREEAGGLRFTLGADVLFDFDKAHLRPEADGILRRLVEEVRRQVPRARYMVEGHTDAKGSDAYNDRLSNRRAASVRDWLVRRGGVSSRTVATLGFGERRPVAPNEHPDGSDDPEGRQLNRRVEVLVTPLP
jgi:outer membrane protein OmpA-like peptidoglycan-associated protein